MSLVALKKADVCREKARDSARRRRNQSKTLMDDLSRELPFDKDIIDQLDHCSRLKLALCYMRTKSVIRADKSNIPNQLQVSDSSIKDLLLESLDGFLLICQSDGVILYVTESVLNYLGHFQSQLIGQSLYNIVHHEDISNLKQAFENTHMKLLVEKCTKWTSFCRVKCNQRTSLGVTQSYKVVHMSGTLRLQDDGSFLLRSLVSLVTPPSIIELSVKDNMFITHYSMEMKCIYTDGRLSNLLGYTANDIIGHVPFEFHHHNDINVTLDCSKELMSKGEGMSGYYRFLSKSGNYVWMQSRATFVYDKQTGHPLYIVCVNYVLVDEEVKERNGLKTIKQTIDPLPVDTSMFDMTSFLSYSS